jgi:hypothetical protein
MYILIQELTAITVKSSLSKPGKQITDFLTVLVNIPLKTVVWIRNVVVEALRRHDKLGPCHHDMALLRVVYGGTAPPIWRVASNILNRQ